MATVYFIGAQYVKNNSVVDENVDDKYISIAIQKAQRNHLLYLLGTGLYDEIAGQIQNSTLTANNTTLLNTYIAPTLLSYTLVELMPHLLYKLSNRNLGTKDSDKTTATDWRGMDRIMERYENDAELEANKLKNYLTENVASFPLYLNPGTGVDIIYPKKDTFECGIFTGKRYQNVSRIDRLKYPGYYGAEED